MPLIESLTHVHIHYYAEPREFIEKHGQGACELDSGFSGCIEIPSNPDTFFTPSCLISTGIFMSSNVGGENVKGADEVWTSEGIRFSCVEKDHYEFLSTTCVFS